MRKLAFAAAMMFLSGAMLSAATLLEADFTKGEDAIAQNKFDKTNIVVIPGAGVIGTEAGKYNSLRRPAENLFTPESWTVVLEVSPVVDTESFTGKGVTQSLTMMEILGPDGQSFSAGACLSTDYGVVNLKAKIAGQEMEENQAIKWAKGSVHKLTFSWNGSSLKAMLDDATIFEAKLEEPPKAPTCVSVSGYSNNVFAIRKITITDGK